MPIWTNSLRAAWIIGSSSRESGESVEISAEMIICVSVQTACALYPCTNPRGARPSRLSGSVMFARADDPTVAGGGIGLITERSWRQSSTMTHSRRLQTCRQRGGRLT